MSTKTVERIASTKSPLVVIWTLTDGETGPVQQCVGFNDKSVHVFGDFQGASVAIKGGNTEDGSKFATLKDFDAADLTFAALGINSIRDNVGFMQPVVTGGTNSAITVVVLME